MPLLPYRLYRSNGNGSLGPLLSSHRSLRAAQAAAALLRTPLVLLDPDGFPVSVEPIDRYSRLIDEQQKILREQPIRFFQLFGLNAIIPRMIVLRFPLKSQFTSFSNEMNVGQFHLNEKRCVYTMVWPEDRILLSAIRHQGQITNLKLFLQKPSIKAQMLGLERVGVGPGG